MQSPQPRIILGLDPALHKTGWGVIRQDGSRLSFIACGTIITNPKDETPARLAHLYTALQGIVAEYRPHTAAVEEVYVNNNARTSLVLGQARGMCLLVPTLAGLSVGEYPPRLVKKALVGNGAAEKEQVAFMVKTLLPAAKVALANHGADATDALAIAITHAHTPLAPAAKPAHTAAK
ncbi:MAG: crossover junction endodeoxyribonuclease RuvC [Alphaproteobacteria bacterium]